MTGRKGIVLAGGTGSRLYPITLGLSKQLLPIYDKPMIYYPLSVLMLAGIRDIAVIVTPQDHPQFTRLLGDGSQWGIRLVYITQPDPGGLAQAYLLAEDFLDGAPSCMVLGDNIFFGHGLSELLTAANDRRDASTVFAYRVADPGRYGVISFDHHGKVTQITEKPEIATSDFALTGLYFLDGTAPQLAKTLRPSPRGELEITDLLTLYLRKDLLSVQRMGRGFAWLDTGTHASLLDAGNFVRTLQQRQGMQTGCLEEIAWHKGWINHDQLCQQAENLGAGDYGRYLRELATVGKPQP